MRPECFVYDGDGNRIKKTEAGETTLYVNQFYERNLTTSEVVTHYYLSGKEVAYRKSNDLRYMHQDHLGSTSVTTNTSGAQVSKVAYFPFGGQRSMTGTLDTDKKFTGQRLDQTGLYYYNARYYDATIGRFISPDTIVPNPANPQSLNRYSYCLNNPLRYTDPSGHDWFDIAIAGYFAQAAAAMFGIATVQAGANAAAASSNADLVRGIELATGITPEPVVPVVTQTVVAANPKPTYPQDTGAVAAIASEQAPKKPDMHDAFLAPHGFPDTNIWDTARDSAIQKGIPIPESNPNKWAQNILIGGVVTITPFPGDDYVYWSWTFVKITRATPAKFVINKVLQYLNSIRD